ncbi:hypothetical protein [Edaphobacter albus]|uniref:hypothetical protein n=1 Tax=Edaphobacter sp. 4G125 TaxID=2763071 RepID=UPI001648481E|nr:hypothetical protein [Edaphobacter sp. 4G125]QNI37556.1 hypothetical protein H7846_04430 [Edaphobacter sp. 4G125]
MTRAKSSRGKATIPAIKPAFMSPPTDNNGAAVLTDPNTINAYKSLYDALGNAYWKATDIDTKDTIQAARDNIYEILTDLNVAKLEENTEQFSALKQKIDDSNTTLSGIKDKIDDITKDLSTAASVVAAIAKVASITSVLS